MCLGIPMRVVSVSDYNAICQYSAQKQPVETALIDGTLQAGDYVLVHNGRAIRKLEEKEAENIANALHAVTLAARGEDFIGLFSDLIDREPPLPDHLKKITVIAEENS